MKKISKNLHDACEYYAEKNGSMLISEAAKLFNVDRHSISKHIPDYTNYSFFKDEEYYFLTNEELEPVMYFLEHKNESLLSVANKFKTKSETIKRRIDVIGETYEKRLKRKFNRRAFQTLITEEQAYWLGFILADGYINEDRGFLKIKLGKQDESHLIKFASFMGEENLDVLRYETGGAYTKDNVCVGIEFDSKELVNDLKQYKLYQNKSGKESPIFLDDEKLQIAYIRGMIDGDGHIEDGYFKYVGSEESCNYLKNIFSKWYNFKEECLYIYPHGTIYSFEIRSKEVNKILHTIYDNASIYLDRKYNIVQKI